MSILVVEDEPDLSDVLSFMLRRAGYEVILASDGEAALRMWRERDPDLVLLDVNLPKKTGWEVCAAIREESSTPIVFLTSADSEDEMVQGLDLGAEDYVTKPFSPRLLQSRIKSVLRRERPQSTRPAAPATISGDLRLDAELRTLNCGENSITLTKLEHRIVQELMLHFNLVVPHDALIQKAWGYKGEASSNLVKGHIHNIRNKLTQIGSTCNIRIVAAVGYILSQTDA